VDFGETALKVAAALAEPARGRTPGKAPPSSQKQLRALHATLRKAAGEVNAEAPGLVRVVDNPLEAHWLVCKRGESLFLLRPDALTRELVGNQKAELVVRGRAGDHLLTRAQARQPGCRLDVDPAFSLPELLQRLARADVLRRLAAESGTTRALDEVEAGSNPFWVEIIFRRPRKPGEIDLEGPHAPAAGETVTCEVVNRSGRATILVTAFRIDRQLAITRLYPPEGHGPQRLGTGSGAEFDFKVGEGPQTLVLIAVDGSQGDAVDFDWLTQPGLDKPEGTRGQPRGDNRALKTPLGRLLGTTLAGAGAARGVRVTSGGEFLLDLRCWTAKKRGPAR
jgi:hypothetical protein